MTLLHHPFSIQYGTRFPTLNGKIKVNGIKSKVTIIRDSYGVPYIISDNPLDSWFGLGLCQAQDRAYQLEILKRQGRGNLSEIFGQETLPWDRLARRIGFYRIAEDYCNTLDDEISNMLSAFTDGINAGLEKGMPHLAHEFSILDFEPTPYSRSDILATILVLGFSLTHWIPKLTRYKLMIEDGVDAVIKTDPPYAKWNPVISPVSQPLGDQIDPLLNELQLALNIVKREGFSNNWVLDSQKTTTGRPILANDPHLGALIPAPWYLACVKAGEAEIAGACYPGTPAFIIGHNKDLAWGITAAFIDNIDLYLEEYNADTNSTRMGDHYIESQQYSEIIKVRNGSDVVEKVLITHNGPVISPALNPIDNKVISFKAAWMHPCPVEGFFKTHLFKNVDELRDGFRSWPLATFNILAADKSGDICWQTVGGIPKRHGFAGLTLLPGWDPKFQWEDFQYPYEINPNLKNPDTHYIVTANNPPIQDQSKTYIGRDYIDGYRQARIVNLVKASDEWDLESTSNLQVDQFSIPWKQIESRICQIHPQSINAKMALDILAGWDGYLTATSIEATIFEVFISIFVKKYLEEVVPNSYQWIYHTFNPSLLDSCYGISRISQIVFLISEQPQELFGNEWDSVLSGCLDAAYSNLINEFGEPSKRWELGNARPVTIYHISSDSLQEKGLLVDEVFNIGPFEWGGNTQAVSVAGGDFRFPLKSPSVIPNLRVVMDVGDWENNIFQLAGGQSGNPLSDNYADLFNLWKHGQGVTIHWNLEIIQDNGRNVLEVIPQT
jgi:penicillin amidase